MYGATLVQKIISEDGLFTSEYHTELSDLNKVDDLENVLALFERRVRKFPITVRKDTGILEQEINSPNSLIHITRLYAMIISYLSLRSRFEHGEEWFEKLIGKILNNIYIEIDRDKTSGEIANHLNEFSTNIIYNMPTVGDGLPPFEELEGWIVALLNRLEEFFKHRVINVDQITAIYGGLLAEIAHRYDTPSEEAQIWIRRVSARYNNLLNQSNHSETEINKGTYALHLYAVKGLMNMNAPEEKGEWCKFILRRSERKSDVKDRPTTLGQIVSFLPLLPNEYLPMRMESWFDWLAKEAENATDVDEPLYIFHSQAFHKLLRHTISISNDFDEPLPEEIFTCFMYILQREDILTRLFDQIESNEDETTKQVKPIYALIRLLTISSQEYGQYDKLKSILWPHMSELEHAHPDHCSNISFNMMVAEGMDPETVQSIANLYRDLHTW